jgi:hypothetical protein
MLIDMLTVLLDSEPFRRPDGRQEDRNQGLYLCQTDQTAHCRARRRGACTLMLWSVAATCCPARMAQPGAGELLPDLKSKVQIVIWRGYG